MFDGQLDRTMAKRGFQGTLEDCTDGGERLDRLIAEADAHLGAAIRACDGYEITGIVLLFSGGNDSTVLAHLFRHRVSHYLHSNTQMGAEPTRQFVRDTTAGWGVPLLEGNPRPGRTYEDLVLRRAKSVASYAKYEHIYIGGFPLPADHRVMFGHLKGWWMEQAEQVLAPRPASQRVIYIGGMRASESAARMRRARSGALAPVRIGKRAMVNVSPLLSWTKLDLNDYRRRFPDCPENEIAAFMHKSLECMCGCYAEPGELDFTRACVPTLADSIDELQERVRGTAKLEGWDVDPRRLTWGAGGKGKCASGLCNV